MAVENIALKGKLYFLPGRGDRKVGRVIEDCIDNTGYDDLRRIYLRHSLAMLKCFFLGGGGGVKWGRCILLLAIAVNIHSKSKLIF